MITTVDGVTKQVGDGVYFIAWGSQSGSYYVCAEVIDDLHDALNFEKFWHSKSLCQEQCNLMNKDLKQ